MKNKLKNIIKKALNVLLIIAILLPNISYATQDEISATWYFVVTAYYSPLPYQQYYLKGNYIDEKILNWEWIRWASGKPVFNWMLAWPKPYAFWTKVYIEWLWIWEVSDRWGAIVTAWNRGYDHDRIDVWMWYWEEGLKRALAWWKRTVPWYIVENDNQVDLDTSKINTKNVNLAKLKNSNTIFTQVITKNSNISDVTELQELLLNFWFYTWEINWIFDDNMTNAIINFQINNNIITSRDDIWAWVWWPKTRSLAKSLTQKKIELVTKNETIIAKEEQIKEKVTLADLKDQELEKIFTTPLLWTSSSDDIKKVENIFKELWYTDSEPTWKYSNLSKLILQFQLENNIVTTKNDTWAYYFWPKTRETLKKIYSDFKKTWKNTTKPTTSTWITINSVKKEPTILEKLEFSTWSVVEKVNANEVFNLAVSEISSQKDIIKVKTFLNQIWYYKKEINWNYEDLRLYLIEYQVKNKIIKNKSELWAGNFWPRTRAFLKNDYLTLQIENEKKRIASENKKIDVVLSKQELAWMSDLRLWYNSNDVRILQKYLKTLWYFDIADTWYFWEKTQTSLKKYQATIKDKSVKLWVFDKITREQIIKDLVK